MLIDSISERSLRMMGVFIEWPWLALIPCAVFGLLYRLSGRRLVAALAVTWLCYALYEYGMRRRWLCSGECNIRVDLLLLYPVLALLSVAALIVAVRALRRPQDAAR